jgi:hypothetical protein
VRAAHLVAGSAIVGAFGILFLWGLVTWIIRRGPGQAFWWVVGFVQGAVLIQALVGVILLFTGGRATILHIVYGAIFPAWPTSWPATRSPTARGRRSPWPRSSASASRSAR